MRDGDALANWANTRKSIELIQQADPEVIFACQPMD
ncbi:hypothetical protein N752_17655 [Desulforamulus aquiferis]|nr:hypothetical protein N752_17655 [Desulforamulus aquiferis]